MLRIKIKQINTAYQNNNDIKEDGIMNKFYTITESTQDDTITLSYHDDKASIVLQEYSEEKQKEFLDALEIWE